MTPRLTVALTAVLLTTGAAAAHAAPARPVCGLVVDPAGDAKVVEVLPSSPGIDILSADLATGRKNLVAVVRLGSVGNDPMLATGRTVTFGWRAGAVEQAVSYVQYSDGSRVATWDPNTHINASGDTVEVPVVVDPTANTVTWTLSRKLNPVLAKGRARFAGLTVTASPATSIGADGGNVNVSFSGNFLTGDEASSGKTYTDLMPSCLKGG